VAGHWAQSANTEGRTKAVSYFRRAGDDALDRLGPADAVRYYAQALELVDLRSGLDPLEVVDLKIGIGVGLRQLGERGAREVLLEAAAEALALGDGGRLSRAVLENDRGFFSAYGQLDTEKVALLEAALQQPAENSAERALVLATYCQELTFASPLALRLQLAENAISVARSTGNPTTVVRVLNRVDGPLRVPQELARSLERSEEAQQCADAMGDPVLRFWAATARRVAAAQAGDLAEVDRCLGIMEELARSVGQPTLSWVNIYARATRVLLAGELAMAEQLANWAFEIGSDGDEPDAFPVLAAQLLSINSQRGTMGQMIPLIEQAVLDNPGIPAFWSVLAAAHVEADRADLARPILEAASVQGFTLPMNVAWLTGMVTYAEAAIECREARFAEPLFDLLAPWADLLSYNDVTVEGPVSHYLGGLAWVLGRHQQAAEFFDAAARFSDRIGAPCFGARTKLNWARMLLDQGQPSESALAERLLDQALEAARRGGYETTVRRANSLLHGNSGVDQ
jgi:tetratricopeptide (TPR) repeat protein